MIGLAVAGVSFAMSVQVGANFNFVAEEINASGQQAGNLEAVRETCGITALGVLALLAGLAEPLVGAAMLVLMAVGMSSYALPRLRLGAPAQPGLEPGPARVDAAAQLHDAGAGRERAQRPSAGADPDGRRRRLGAGHRSGAWPDRPGVAGVPQ